MFINLKNTYYFFEKNYYFKKFKLLWNYVKNLIRNIPYHINHIIFKSSISF